MRILVFTCLCRGKVFQWRKWRLSFGDPSNFRSCSLCWWNLITWPSTAKALWPTGWRRQSLRTRPWWWFWRRPGTSRPRPMCSCSSWNQTSRWCRSGSSRQPLCLGYGLVVFLPTLPRSYILGLIYYEFMSRVSSLGWLHIAPMWTPCSIRGWIGSMKHTTFMIIYVSWC